MVVCVERKLIVDTQRVRPGLTLNYQVHLIQLYARVVELVDTLALGASASGREGSSPFSRTNRMTGRYDRFFYSLS